MEEAEDPDFLKSHDAVRPIAFDLASLSSMLFSACNFSSIHEIESLGIADSFVKDGFEKHHELTSD
jgi:hypothetical protein